MTLWNWVVAAYQRPGVPETCLALQDEDGLNTSLVLWAAWAGRTDPELLARACALARSWEGLALGPLRAVRRDLKAPAPPVDDSARLALREQVKAAELAAERLLVETLEALAPASSGSGSAAEAMAAAAKAWGSPAPSHRLAALAAALE